MELSQLQYFLMVSQCGKIKDAAEALNISQSGVSMAISRLEDELGVELLARDGRNIRLTEAGHYFADRIAPSLAGLEEAKREMNRLREEKPEIITLTSEATDYVSTVKLIYLRTYQRNVRFRHTLDTIVETRHKLYSGAVDFAITFEPLDRVDVESIKVLDEPMLVQLSVFDPLAERERLRLAELRDHPFVSWPLEYGARKWMETLCARAGFRAYVPYVESDEQSMLSTTWVMRAAKLVAWHYWDQYADKQPILSDRVIRTIPLEESFCRRHLFLSYLKNRAFSESAAQFLAFMRKCGELTLSTGVLPRPHDFDHSITPVELTL